MFNLKKKKNELEREIIILEAKRDTEKEKLDLESELRGLKESISGLRTDHREEKKNIEHDRKIADEDIKHMVRMKEERLAIDHEKKIVKCDKEKAEAIAAVKDTYRDKIEERLEKEVVQIKDMYEKVLERLPNVNVKMNGKI